MGIEPWIVEDHWADESDEDSYAPKLDVRQRTSNADDFGSFQPAPPAGRYSYGLLTLEEIGAFISNLTVMI